MRYSVNVRTLLVGLLFVLTATLPLTLASASAEEIKDIRLLTGQSIVLQTPGLTRVGTGDKTIAGIFPIANTAVLLNGKSPGKTTVLTWMGDRRVTYEVTVIDQNLDEFVRLLHAEIKSPDVRIITLNHSVVLEGTVETPEEFLDLDDVFARFQKTADDNKYELVNAVTVARPMGDLQGELNALPGVTATSIERDGKGNIIVSGRVLDDTVAQKVIDRVRANAGGYLAPDGKIEDRLTVDTTTEVDIKVYVLEVDRTAQSQLGLRLQSGTPIQGEPGYYTLGPANFPVQEEPKSATSPISALGLGTFVRTTILAPTLDLVLNTGHSRILSSPDLVTLPGKEGTFLVGGQIPIPVASGPSQVTIVYKDYGIQLKVTPNVLPNGTVESVVAPEVSQLDFADGVDISGFEVPALKTSRLSTDVVTQPGESIVLGGLMSRVEQRNINKIPLLGDIPILGQLFRSTSYQSNETDLVFVMTPEVIAR
jgi:Flp pilus assembly secretin CpaC